MLVKDDGTTQVGWISFGNPPSGSYAWDPAKVQSALGFPYNVNVPDGTYKVRAIDYNDPRGTAVGYDLSDTPFTIASATQAQPALSVTADTSLAPADHLVMGSSNNALAYLRFAEVSGTEDVKITALNVRQIVSPANTPLSFQAMRLYKSTDLSTPLPASWQWYPSSDGGFYHRFSISSQPIVVPKSGSVLLVLKGDVFNHSSGAVADNSKHALGINTSLDATNNTPQEAVMAYGSASNQPATISLPPGGATGNSMLVFRSKLSFATQQLGVSSGRSKQPSDNLAFITLSADPAGAVAVNNVTVTFGGTAPAHPDFLNGVQLIDESGLSLGSGNVVSSQCTGANTCSKTFNLGAGSSGQIIAAGTSRTFMLRADSTRTATAQANVSQTLTATINSPSDVSWTTALDAQATSGIGLSPRVLVPINLNAVSYVTGT